jgi:protein transport protein SEC31
MGLIAGGMDDGSTHIWNPAAMVSENGAHSLVAKISQQKSGAVSALAFNPHPSSANLLATGGSQGEILITSLDNPEQPAVTYPSDDGSHQNAEITNIAWNSEVAHIVASSAGDGTAAVWDLRQSKLWCQIRCEGNGGPVSSLGWNPSQGMHLMTASSDDRNPVLKLWDLRASMSMPLATLEGHAQGILGMHWCPHDDSLLVSCGKDNQTLLWDVPSLKAIADIPNEEIEDQSGEITKQMSSSELYGHGLSTSQQRRYDVQWSPIRKGILSTCSFDRKVQIHSVIGAATKCGRPPKWMKPASGVSCGMGGSVVSFASTHKLVTISSFVEQEALKKAAVAFEAATTNGDYSGFSYEKAQSAAKAGDAAESQIWGIMQCIFEENAREKLLFYLGFDPSEIQAAAMKFDSEEKKEGTEPSSTGDKVMMSKSAENIVHKSLLVGNFEAAVECCFRSGNLADALVLASCGGPELWSKTQARYFASQAAKRPFLSVVSSVVHNKLKEFVAESDPSRWHETLAILCTYATADDFVPLCEALGDHLGNSGDVANASIVFMCAMNLEKASQYWEIQLRESEKYDNVSGFLPLHSYVEKVAVFLQASSNANNIPENVAENLFKYSKVLSEQGLFEIAAKYCKGTSQESKVLRDRLYRGKDSEACLRALGSPPEFPFEFVNVGVAPKKSQSNGTSHSNGSSNYNVHNNSQGTKHGYGHDNGNRNGHSNGNTRQQAPHQNGGTTISMLPSGWVALQDPSSGRTYYANQSTGQTSWERPSVPENTNTTTNSYANNASNQIPTSSSRPTQPSNPSTMVSKYGDGFVTSASHPELGEQYGNLGTRYVSCLTIWNLTYVQSLTRYFENDYTVIHMEAILLDQVLLSLIRWRNLQYLVHLIPRKFKKSIQKNLSHW